MSLFSPEAIQQRLLEEQQVRQQQGLAQAAQNVATAPDLAGRLAGLGSSIGQGAAGLFAKQPKDTPDVARATAARDLLQKGGYDLKTVDGWKQASQALIKGGMIKEGQFALENALKIQELEPKEVKKWTTFTDKNYPDVLFRQDETGKREVIMKPPAQGTVVNVGEKEGAKFAVTELKSATEAANYAIKTKDSIQFIRGAMKGIETGKLSDIKVNLGEFAASFNIDMPDIANLRSANTAMGQMVMAGLNNFPGQISNEERQFVAGIMPKLTQTSKGREAIMEFLDRLSSRAVDYRKLMTAHVKSDGYELITGKSGSFYEKWDKFLAENPLLESFKALDLGVDEPEEKTPSPVRNKWEGM